MDTYLQDGNICNNDQSFCFSGSCVTYDEQCRYSWGPGMYTAQHCVSIGKFLNLLSSILTNLLTCPNNNTLLCYSNKPFLTVYFSLPVVYVNSERASLWYNLANMSLLVAFSSPFPEIVSAIYCKRQHRDTFPMHNEPVRIECTGY